MFDARAFSFFYLLGAYSRTENEFRSALESLVGWEDTRPIFRFGRSGNWRWAHTIWNHTMEQESSDGRESYQFVRINSNAIDAAFRNLSFPCLRLISTEEMQQECWALSLVANGKGPFHGVHCFDYLETGDCDAACFDGAVDQRVQCILDELMPGVHLPDRVVQQMTEQSGHDAARTAFVAHGMQIITALEEAGLEFDRKALISLLTRESLTDDEQGANLGNLPRFLKAIGIDGVFL